MTFLPGEQLDARVEAAAAVERLGLLPVPHLSARRLTSAAELEGYLDRLAQRDRPQARVRDRRRPARAGGAPMRMRSRSSARGCSRNTASSMSASRAIPRAIPTSRTRSSPRRWSTSMPR
ncbi:MAG: hypothetical protein WDN24_17385 [Sphingomonas sp.]